MKFECVPIPDRMKHLEKDARGYPIPHIVLRDKEGTPHFTVNDHTVVRETLVKDQCGICGTKLFRGRWFVGGPMSAYHPQGAYMDGPLHSECMRYAMQVCPYLAAPNYGKRIDTAKIKEGQVPDHSIFLDNTMIPDRPNPFVCVMAIGQTYRANGPIVYMKPNKPYVKVEFWKDGVLLPEQEGAALVEAAVRSVKQNGLPEIQGPRLIEVKPGARKHGKG
jgi:hypothetical protein